MRQKLKKTFEKQVIFNKQPSPVPSTPSTPESIKMPMCFQMGIVGPCFALLGPTPRTGVARTPPGTSQVNCSSKKLRVSVLCIQQGVPIFCKLSENHPDFNPAQADAHRDLPGGEHHEGGDAVRQGV